MDNFSYINDHINKERLNVYLGSEKKKTLIMDDGQQYMLKLPDPTREKNRELSYINNSLSEYIGCRVYKSVGIPVQDTYLGIYTTEEGKDKIACLCRDFANDGIVLHEAEKLELSSDSISSEPEKNITLPLVRNIIDDAIKDPQKAEQTWNRYCDRIIVDSLIGNTDRHNGNWGIAEYPDGSIDIAPVFDCGSSFSSLLEDDELTPNIARREALTAMSAIRDENTGRKIPYAELIDGYDPDIENALKRIVPSINLSDIEKIVDDIPYISDERKQFYTSLTDIRYREQLIPALERSLDIGKSSEYKQWNSKMIGEIYEIFEEPLNKLNDNSISEVTINKKKYTVKKNNDYIFILDNDPNKEKRQCQGVFSFNKTNANIGKFIQCMRDLDNEIDLDLVRSASVDIAALAQKGKLTFEISKNTAHAQGKIDSLKTRINTDKQSDRAKSQNKERNREGR